MKSRRERFDHYRSVVRHVSSMPFEWGKNDCALMAALMVSLITGVDHSKGWHPYNERTALRWIREAGGMENFVTRFLGQSSAPNDWDRMRPGDVVMLEQVGRSPNALALWNGVSCTCFRDTGGMMTVGRDHIECFWLVG